jgi:hypothetical protein
LTRVRKNDIMVLLNSCDFSFCIKESTKQA